MNDRIVHFQRHAKVVFRELGDGGGGVLLHLESGQYHGLNRTGTVIWNLLDSPRTLDEMLEEAKVLLPDAPAHLQQDIEAFVDGLLKRDLIQIHKKDAGTLP